MIKVFFLEKFENKPFVVVKMRSLHVIYPSHITKKSEEGLASSDVLFDLWTFQTSNLMPWANGKVRP